MMPSVKLSSLRNRYTEEDDVISANIRELIAVMNVTQIQFADLLGVTAPTVRKWIRNPGVIKINDYRHICTLMDKYRGEHSVGGAM